MANSASIARPYALAAFEYSRQIKQMPAWKQFLAEAAWLATQPAVTRLMEDPATSTEKLHEFFLDILSSQLLVNKEQQNFLELLTENKRLNALPDIAEKFNEYEAALAKISNVRLVTAVETDTAYQQKLADALSKRMQAEVKLSFEIDPQILGGAILYMGDDRVIDASVKQKLSRLLASLTG